MHERLRLELLRRIQRGSLSVSLLARQTGYGQSHMSSFLRSRKQLWLEAMDRLLAAQHMTPADLLPSSERSAGAGTDQVRDRVPLVSHQAAMFEPNIRPTSALKMLPLPEGLLKSMRPRVSTTRRTWERFVALRVSSDDAQGMEPVLWPEAIAVLDRHYNALNQYRSDRANLYAVRKDARLSLRYVELAAGRLVLRPHCIGAPVELIEVDLGESPSELIVGRVALVLNET